MKKFFLFAIVSVLSIQASTLEILYDIREPYVIQDDKSILGLVATPIINALNKSGVKYKLVKNSSKRHIISLKNNKKQQCAIGWFKKPERELFAKFTNFAYQDKPMILIINKNNFEILKYKNIDELLKSKTITALTKDSYSYGSFIDEKLVAYNTKQTKTFGTNTQMLNMIYGKRADFMFSSLEESKSLLDASKHKDTLTTLEIDGLPKGNKRYLMCSKSVDDSTIEAINKYISTTK